MSSVDIDQARKYIELLRGDSNAIVCWQLFDDSGLGDSYPEVFHGKLNDVEKRINQLQQKGYGAYVTINPTDGMGRKIENITRYDWAFADVDGSDIPDDYPLLPAFISRRDDQHGHVYWPIEGCLTVKQYNAVQRRIALYLDSDQQVVDPARVARVPGFLHLKEPGNPQSYYISHDNSKRVNFSYSIDEVENAFALSPELELELTNWLQNDNAIDVGTGINDNPIYREQFLNFIKDKAPIAVKGEGRSETLFKVACFGRDRGLASVEAQQLLWAHYNPRCNPPWTEKEKPNFFKYIKNAWQHGRSAIGCKTTQAVFAATDPLPEPVGGWDANASIAVEDDQAQPFVEVNDRFGYITTEQSAINQTKITNKSSVTDIAYLFIGKYYPNKTLLRNNKVFYAYNGVHWDEVSDDLINHQIAKMVSGWKFPPSKITNIYKIVEMTMYQRSLIKGEYLDSSKTIDGHSFIMKNGIVKIDKGEVNITPHDSDLFDLNSLDYDYNPNANCDEFLAFIESQWPGDKEMHDQLQELYGLCLVSENKFDLLPLMVGKSRSGKGVHGRLMTAMLGDVNVCFPELESLIEHSTMHDMSSKKLAIVPEANALHPNIKNRVLNRLKSLTGGDGVTYDRKYLSSEKCTKWPIIIIQSNELPEFADGSGAYGNRVWPFHFKRSFAGKEDRGLTARLSTPESISGIHAWAVRGLVRILKNGKPTQAKSSMEMIDEIKYETFPLSSFVEEFCNTGDANKTDFEYADDLYDFYLVHCKLKKQPSPFSPQKFSRILKSCHLEIYKEREKGGVHRRYIFTGIKMNDIAKQKYMPSFGAVDVDKNNIING